MKRRSEIPEDNPGREINFDVKEDERVTRAGSIVNQMNMMAIDSAKLEAEKVMLEKGNPLNTLPVVLSSRVAFEFGGVKMTFEKGVAYFVNREIYCLLVKEGLVA
jgi:hypothetical protein